MNYGNIDYGQENGAYLGMPPAPHAEAIVPIEELRALPPYYLSAYGLAVQNGFVGTESEWLESLKGDSGLPGDNCVTPEMYGAVGDGITDDTQAWQDAVDSGCNVLATRPLYKCGKITVRKNITIDCAYASFIATDATLFEFIGTIVATLTGEKNYAANDVAYTITNEEYANYTGFAMLQGTKLFDESRGYYYGGFACTFRNGIIEGSYPIDVINGTDNITIEIIRPITATLKNLGDISYADTTGRGIYFLYGVGCLVENVRTNTCSKYVLVSFWRCLNCTCRNLNISAELGVVGTNSYIVGIEDSSYCSVRDSYFYNKYWHCITTGANYLCYRNLVENCVMLSDTGMAYVDHANGVGTTVKDSKCTGMLIGYMGSVDNVVVESRSSANTPCSIIVAVPTDNRLVGVSLNNITFIPAAGTPDNQCGIVISGGSRLENKTLYAHNIKISNTRILGATAGRIWFSFGTHYNTGGSASIKIGTIELENTHGEIYLGVHVNDADIDITDYKLFARDIKANNASSGELCALGSTTNYKFNCVNAQNCHFSKMIGKCDKLILQNVYCATVIDETALLVKSIEGNDLDIVFDESFFMPDNNTYTCADVAIGRAKIGNDTRYCYNIANDNAGNKYYQAWENGELTTAQITTE